ncbi:hypothetical protein [Spirillospora sp. CA-128828]|uniref:hypothetical protein n=1 Tax=Spirillospora sp. CA-128828 TaxID=3240033 RepID=UPI003D94D586
MKKVAIVAAAGTMGAVAAVGGLYATGGHSTGAVQKVSDDKGLVQVSGDDAPDDPAGGSAGAARPRTRTRTGATGSRGGSPEKLAGTTYFAHSDKRKNETLTHQSDELYASFEGQETCLQGKAWTMVAVFYVDNVTATSAHVSKIEATYRAPIPSKKVYLGGEQFFQADGKQLLRMNVTHEVVIPGGSMVKQTHVINKTVDFRGGPATFRRRANVGQSSGGTEARWCGVCPPWRSRCSRSDVRGIGGLRRSRTPSPRTGETRSGIEGDRPHPVSATQSGGAFRSLHPYRGICAASLAPWWPSRKPKLRRSRRRRNSKTRQSWLRVSATA